MPGKDKPSPAKKPRYLPSFSGGIPFVLAVYSVSRLFYLVAGALLAAYLPVGNFHGRTLDAPPGRLNIWAHWDGVWYSRIAAEGYGRVAWDGASYSQAMEGYATTASTAFFPLYPLLMRSFAGLFGGPLSLEALSLCGVLISLTALPFGFYFIYRIAEDGWGERVAKGTVLIMAFFPTAFFLNAVYTESLFLAFSAGSIWASRVRRDLLLACALAGLATATRNVGVFLLAPLLYEWLRGNAGREYGPVRGAACLALASSGLFFYAAYLWRSFGEPLLFYDAQGYWNRTPTGPSTFVVNILREAYESVASLFLPWSSASLEELLSRLNGTTDAYNFLFLILALAMLLWGLRVLPFSLSVYALLLLIPAALFGKLETPLIGFPRYMLAAFPLFIVLAALLENRRTLGIWLISSAAFSLALCALFVSWRFTA